MRVIFAGVAGAIAMFVWAAAAHLSPLAAIGVHTLPNEGFIVGALQLDLNNHGGVYVFPSAAGDQKATGAASPAAGVLAYTPHAEGAITPRRLGTEFCLQLVESLAMAAVAAMVAGGFGARVRAAVLVGLIAGMGTNGSYWNWYGFGLDYTLATGFIEAMKFVVAGLAIAAVLRRKAGA